MKLVCATMTGLIVLMFASTVFGQEVKAKDRESLETIIPVGIVLLEAKEYELFLKTFVPPDELKKITEKTPLERFAKEFSERKAPRILEVLKEIKGTKPNLTDSDKKAVFTLKEEIASKNSITFLKIEKYWYIQN